MHKHQTYFHLINNFLLYINLDPGEQRGDPSKEKQTKHHHKGNSAFYIFILYNEAVLLKCDHELGFNLANSQINSAKLLRKWKTSTLINACVILLVISTISFMLMFYFVPPPPLKKKGGKAISL